MARTGRPAAMIDASAPEQSFPARETDLPLSGQTTWTPAGGEGGLLVAEFDVELAAEPGAPYPCELYAEVEDNGRRVLLLSGGANAGDTTLAVRRITPGAIPIGLVGAPETHHITVQFTNAGNCAAGSKIKGLRVVVQPLG